MRIVHFLILAAILSAVGSVAQTDYSALNYWKYYSDAENTLYKQQCDIAFDYLDKRKDRIAQLSSADEWNVRRLEVKEMLGSLVGPFPEKTPLNPVITGKVKRDDFTVEKLYFESMPGYKVTAAFYLPKGKKKKLPAIIYCSGHSNLAFRSDTYQHVIINLVKKGFAVFAFDPIGQGERLQYFDEARGASKFGPTHEHSYPGAQLFINGASAARYMIWDGIRCVDYLLTREEVDPERIGITGRSGGGTQTPYIAAFDERIKASAPECYITSLEYLWKSRGPQDAEQNFYRGIVEGYDLADLLEVRAPKPTLMITTTRDIFSIEGSRATFEEARTAYEALGKAENIQMVEDDAGHESTRKNREAMYAFFQEHLNNPGSNRDLNVKIFPVEELYVTETGQISTSIGSKFLFDINRGLARKNCEKLEKSRDKLPAHILNVKRASLELTGYENVKSYGKLIYGGKTAFEDHFLEKYIIECEDGVVLPFIVFNPKNIAAKSVLYLDDIKDKKSDKAHQIPLQLIRRGVRVIVPDMPGYGELGPGYLRGDAYFNNTSFNQWFAGIMNGKSMVAIHAEAMEKVIFHCNELYGASEMSGISTGPFNSSLLHAASFGVDFKEITMINPILSFKSVAENQDYDPACVPFAVAGQLEHYDLPDLVVSIAPKKVGIINAVDHQGKLQKNPPYPRLIGLQKKLMNK
ncbi:MAG: acetylxylan esterase [Cytophagales bacterium]|nr:acetylxylan esterase [Cytophagales bacterium]